MEGSGLQGDAAAECSQPFQFPCACIGNARALIGRLQSMTHQFKRKRERPQKTIVRAMIYAKEEVFFPFHQRTVLWAF